MTSLEPHTLDQSTVFYSLPTYCNELRATYFRSICSILLLLLLLLIEVGSARLRESDIHPISPKTPAPKYQPIDSKKRKVKIVEDYSRDRAACANKKSIDLALETRQYHTIEYGVSKIVPEGHLEGNENHALLRGSAAMGHKYTDVRPGNRV